MPWLVSYQCNFLQARLKTVTCFQCVAGVRLKLCTLYPSCELSPRCDLEGVSICWLDLVTFSRTSKSMRVENACSSDVARVVL